MTPKEVIKEFCELARDVGAGEFKNKIPSDCFCTEAPGFQFDKEIIRFIRQATVRAMVANKVATRPQTTDKTGKTND